MMEGGEGEGSGGEGGGEARVERGTGLIKHNLGREVLMRLED